jgi:pyruvate dehydrogenase E1 component
VTGPVVAVSDYMKSLPNGIARWMPKGFTVLGTDGFGLSESRPDLRDYFEVSAAHIVQAALVSLYRDGELGEQEMQERLAELNIDPAKPNPTSR